MKYVIYVTNCLLIIAVPLVFAFTPVKQEKNQVIKTEVKTKKVKSGVLKIDKIKELDKKDTKKETKEEKKTEVKEAPSTKQDTTLVKQREAQPVVRQTQPRVVAKPAPKSTPKPTTDVLETIKGKMSGYGPDCKGCSGNLASGINARNGNIYYKDKKYGRIRIVAGDRKYRFGTIVRIKNSKVGNNIIAVVLDRGSNIGIGKKFLFDLLYSSNKEAAKYEVSYNVTFEILRYGY